MKNTAVNLSEFICLDALLKSFAGAKGVAQVTWKSEAVSSRTDFFFVWNKKRGQNNHEVSRAAWMYIFVLKIRF